MRISDWSSDVCSSDLPSFKPLCAPVCRRDESIGGVDRLWSRAKNGIGRRDLVGMTPGLAVKTKIMTLATFRHDAFLIDQPVIYTVERCLHIHASRHQDYPDQIGRASGWVMDWQ